MKLSESTHNIESLISQHKAARLSTLEARRQLENAEAAEHNLLLSIEAWAESNGFDIRLLDEPEGKPELVITDWRDLQDGDVIWWSGGSNNEAGEYEFCGRWHPNYSDAEAFPVKTGHSSFNWVYVSCQQWKFIRRPTKQVAI